MTREERTGAGEGLVGRDGGREETEKEVRIKKGQNERQNHHKWTHSDACADLEVYL